MDRRYYAACQKGRQTFRYYTIVFKVCKEFGFKINVRKTELFLKEAKFCGRIILKNGIRSAGSNVLEYLDIVMHRTRLKI